MEKSALIAMQKQQTAWRAEPCIQGVVFIKESIRAQCHSKQDDEKNGAQIAALQIQKARVALSTFKIGRRRKGGGPLGESG